MSSSDHRHGGTDAGAGADAGGLDDAASWRALRGVLARLASAVDDGAFLDECLDAVCDALDADRGLVVLWPQDEAPTVVNARDGHRALTPREREEVSKSIIAQVQRTGERAVFGPAAGPSTASIVELDIVTAVAVPLRTAPDQVMGVLYVDFRDPRKEVTARHVDFLSAAATVVALVLERNQRLAETREDLRAARALAGPQERRPSLAELLRPPSLASLREDVLGHVHTDASVLILGESGTGKTLLAHAIAEASGRTPVVRATLGSSDDLNTITSELFGHERGSFSGAASKRVGLVEHADGGTLILDEVLNLPPAAQQLLLDFTQFGTYRPLGHTRAEPKRSRVRIIAVTNSDIQAAIRQGRFRQDLYYRLAVVEIVVPGLRHRREDVPTLALAYLERLDPARDWQLSVPLRRLLLSPELPWKGNIRELQAVLQRARQRALQRDPNATLLGPEHLEPRDFGLPSLGVPPPETVADPGALVTSVFRIEPAELGDTWRRMQAERTALDEVERRLIELTLDKHHGVVAPAARELGVGRTGLASRMQTLGIRRPKPSE